MRHADMGILKQVVHDVAGEIDGHIVEHDRGADLIHAVSRPQKAWDERPQGARQTREEQNQRDVEKTGQADDGVAEVGCGHGTEIQLSLHAHVEHRSLRGDGKGQSGKEQRHKALQGTAEVKAAGKRSVEKGRVGFSDVVPLHQHEPGADDKPNKDRHQHIEGRLQLI